ncbi:MAG: hypothetical protein R3275_07280 [Saprospiraceae bacterium]|nr:hypothetical protein [Saprospiraceae bacterium]
MWFGGLFGLVAVAWITVWPVIPKPNTSRQHIENMNASDYEIIAEPNENEQLSHYKMNDQDITRIFNDQSHVQNRKITISDNNKSARESLRTFDDAESLNRPSNISEVEKITVDSQMELPSTKLHTERSIAEMPLDILRSSELTLPLNTLYSPPKNLAKLPDLYKNDKNHNWSIEFSLLSGIIFSQYSKFNPGAADLEKEFDLVEQDCEALGVDGRVYRQLTSKLHVGIGLRYSQSHISYSQSFTDTFPNTRPDQLIRTIEDWDGAVTDIYGSASGKTIAKVKRANHQLFRTLYTPITLRYIIPTNNLSIFTDLTFNPVVSRWRSGKSIHTSSKDLQLIDLKERYQTRFDASLEGRVGIIIRVASNFSLTGGLSFGYNAFGQKAKNNLWKQSIHEAAFSIGIRSKL